ncbi:EamA family transporter [Clostridium sp. SYSU_GA19001]|uniref:EamA family transporter n=1 Tax=Clostridium caldaquaticum TaxID=2940653 RepID=UPI0020771073|nr:EamA family transporter [Clostridium caldaquaticum]
MLSAGQLLWKTGLKEVSMGSLKDIIHLLLNKYMLGGIAIYITSTFYWFSILKKFDVTKVYPLQSMSYILVLILGYVLLKEPVTKNTIIGTIIIVVGVFIITKQ